MTDVHAATHPSGHPNKTAVNAENPIFGRPADPTPEVSIEQAGVVQSDKHARETVVSPLINEEVLGIYAKPEDASPAEESQEPVQLSGDPAEDVGLEGTPASQDSPNMAESDRFKTGEKVTFSPESGNDTTEVFTIDGGELGEGPDAMWFWRLVEKPGSLFLGRNLQSTQPALAASADA